MSLEEDIHNMVLGADGVAAVYSADPLWLNAVKALGALLGPNGEPAPVPFVVCTEEAGLADDESGAGATRPVMSVQVRIGTDGTLPAPATARSVAALIRAQVALQRPEVDVRAVVAIAAIGS
ncbi:hypothetical protein [Arthrobacter glacialis]|uniref:Uncharacterized protein n=1 Tax=Arthrobacter glacialis TaxID=1664 RepID=A0A2S4A1T5_ARTGL|nr:hypothetical protein [Arthrobacter glacialis]POH61207.1 hypothetical protein CVS28_01550 [Arthrobacter glacialis]POH75344.1 hypothetical protein CVS27_01720 [Arthrobacter glacialis]